ncbi:MAG TPA: hypothetical protein P5280_10315 [Cyclobacteriaceae bacterium]|nr:hypothetical protein [Cyclobacteriaceae bacterium]
MAHIKEFELLHGIVLTKILRSQGATLRLVETDTRQSWAAYTINDSVIVYVKYALTNREAVKENKTVWSFPFQPSEQKKMKELRKSKPVFVALICGLQDIKSHNKMQVCLLEPDEIEKCISLTARSTQTISVENSPNRSLRAYGTLNSADRQKLVVSRNKLDEWEIPGS